MHVQHVATLSLINSYSSLNLYTTFRLQTLTSWFFASWLLKNAFRFVWANSRSSVADTSVSTSFIRDTIPLIWCSTAHLSLDWLRLIRARMPTKWFLMSWHHSLAICTFRWSFSWYVLVMVVHKLAIACLTMTTTTVPMNDESLLPPNAAQHNAIANWKFCMVLGHQQNSFNGCICIHYAASSYSGYIVIVASIQWKMGKTSCSIFCLLRQVCRPEKCQKINSFNTPFVRANLSHLRYSFMSIKHRR